MDTAKIEKESPDKDKKTNNFFRDFFDQIRVSEEENDLLKPKGYEDSGGLKAGGDLVDVNAEPAKPETEVFQAGQPVVEPVVEVPRVAVEESQAVAPAEEIPSEDLTPPEVTPKNIIQAERQVAEVVETVPPVVSEETTEAEKAQEPATDTAPLDTANSHDKFASRQGDAKAPEAAAIEEIWSPLGDL